jgi:threonine dehydrogenase-like Zn-dependent dehydrogenase
MQALRFDGERPRLEEVDEPRPAEGEALVRVRRAGICSTDLEIVKGYMGFAGTLGHELVGEVVEVASRGDGAWVGRRVTAEINLGCGRCARCVAGLRRHCAERTVLGILGKDGCFAEHVTLPVANLHPVPEGLSDERAAFVEPVAAAFEILEQLRVDPSGRVAVLGDGKLGSLVAMVLRHTGAAITVVGRHEAKLARLAALGLRTALSDEDPGRDFDVVVEATGSPAGFERARALLRPRGTLVLKSTYHGRLELDAAPLVIDEITVVGSRCGPFEPAVRALADGRVDPAPLLEAVYPLADGVRALEHAAERGVSKIQLVPHP